MNAGLLRASALRCGEHRQRRLPGKNDLLIRILKTSILRRCGFPRAPFPTRRTFVLPVCLLGWLKTSTPRWSSYKINLLIIAIICLSLWSSAYLCDHHSLTVSSGPDRGRLGEDGQRSNHITGDELSKFFTINRFFADFSLFQDVRAITYFPIM